VRHRALSTKEHTYEENQFFALLQREYTEDCVFNETLEQHNYNTYSSVHWSTAKKTLYLGLNRHGQPRRVQAKGHNLGRLSAYARVLTQVAPVDRVESLQRRMMGSQHNVRHRHHNRHGRHRQHNNGSDVAQQMVCPTLPAQEKDGRDRFRCRKRKKRKKRKRRCRPGERPGPQCQVAEESFARATARPMTDVIDTEEMNNANGTAPESKRSCEAAASEEACRRQALSVPAKKRKSRIDDDDNNDDDEEDGSGIRNLTLNGKNKAPTSNAKKPNVSVADSQSKKPDLTDGKKRKRKGPPQTNRGNAGAPPSRERYASGTTPSRAHSSQTVPVNGEQRASTASSSSSSSSLSPPGASTALSSVRKPGSALSGRRKPPPSSRNHVARPTGSRRVGKLFGGAASSPGRPRSTTATSPTLRSELARPTSVARVPATTRDYDALPAPRSSLLLTSSSSPCWNFLDNSSRSTSENSSSLVDDESSSTVASDFASGTEESGAAGEISVEVTTFRSDEEDGEDGGSGTTDTTPRMIMSYPLERLAM